MNDNVKITGGCLCGAVRYEANQLPVGGGCCHCRMCQKAVGAPMVPMLHFPREAFRFTSAGEPKFYKSSDIVERGFCGECGTSIIYRLFPELSDKIGVLSATLDNPNEFPPEGHFGVESQMHWLTLSDGFPRTEYVDDYIMRRKTVSDNRQLLRQV